MPFFTRGISTLPGITGLSLSADGVGLAHVVRQKEAPPVLKACEFLRNGDAREQAKAVQELVRGHDLTHGRSVGVMDLGSYNLLQVEPPDVPEAEIKDALRWQIKDLIDFPLDQAVIDFFRAPTQARRGQANVAYVVAARQTQVRRPAEMMRDAKMKITAIDIPEFALRNLVSLLPEDPQGVAFLYLTPSSGLITVTRNSLLFLARDINIGATELHRAAGEGVGNDAADMPSEFQDLLESIVLEVQRSLDYYESNFAQAPIGSLVIAPTDPEIPGLFPFLQSYLGPRVKRLDLGALLEGADLSPELQARCLTAIGAALRTE